MDMSLEIIIDVRWEENRYIPLVCMHTDYKHHIRLFIRSLIDTFKREEFLCSALLYTFVDLSTVQILFWYFNVEEFFVGFFSSLRIKSELMPAKKHFARRQEAQQCRVSLVISQILVYTQGETRYKKDYLIQWKKLMLMMTNLRMITISTKECFACLTWKRSIVDNRCFVTTDETYARFGWLFRLLLTWRALQWLSRYWFRYKGCSYNT